MDSRTVLNISVNQPNTPARRAAKRWHLALCCAVVIGAGAAVPAAGAARNKAKAKTGATRAPIELVTNVRESKVKASAAFVRLGSFDSKRPKLGEITVECKGAQAPACRITSSVAGPLRLKNGGAVVRTPSPGATPSAAKGKGKNRTPGGVGGGGGGGGGGGSTGSTTASTSPPTESTPPAAPPNTGTFDIDIDWNPCFFDDSLCFHISYDMGGDGVMAGPDGSGDTVDGLPGDINIGRGSPRL